MAVSPELIDAERRRLLLIAYRICGSWADAEDAVQQASVEGWRKGQSVDRPEAWLTTTTVRRSIDLLRARQRGPVYPGPWLPEPIAEDDPSEALSRDETLSFGFLVLAEALSPEQRAVVILRALDLSHREIAGILEITEAASRQHGARAHRRLARAAHGRRAAEQVDPPATAELLEAFLTAAREGDLDQLRGLLHDDVRGYQDGGGRTKHARRVLVGPEKIARFCVGVAHRHPTRIPPRRRPVNGAPGVEFQLSDSRHILTAEVRDGRIIRLFDVCNPEKQGRGPGASRGHSVRGAGLR